MTCIKTGANVLLTSHGGVLHGDMFLVGDTFIFHHCGMNTMSYEDKHCDYVFGRDTFGDCEVIDSYCMWLDSANIIAMDYAFVEVVSD